ncbi:hypothetical protein ACPV4W_07365 [Vibrio diabolicus]|uniref:hypothetical protein n=1 Tax=Vibrio diabolicus TaxID=50719 RepID=UPI0040689088
MQKNTLIAVALSSLTLVGCASTPQTAAEITKDQLEAQATKNEVEQEKAQAVLASVPRWVINPPKRTLQAFTGSGVGESSKLQLAIKKVWFERAIRACQVSRAGTIRQ